MSDYFDRVERQIAQRVQSGVPRARRPRVTSGSLAAAAAVIVVIIVAGALLAARGHGGGAPSPASRAAASVDFTASPANPRAIDQSVRVMRQRLNAALPGARVAARSDGITITLSHFTARARARVLALAAPGRIAFYDWEANLFTPDGKIVATRLPDDQLALAMSQGVGGPAPGELGEPGNLSLHQALALAAKLAPHAPRRPEYVGRLKLSVPNPLVVLQVADQSPFHVTAAGAPYAQFLVLKARPALPALQLTKPQAVAQPPAVAFSFTAGGARRFQSFTAALAERGATVSGLGQTLNQHFAIALDNKLISVPFIDFKQYPEGIGGEKGAVVSGNFTAASAKDLAIVLRYGPLPVHLTATG